MARPRYTKRDKNHNDIVSKCRELGMVVWDLADIGGEVLDIVVFWRGKAIPVEIKSPDNTKLTKGEKSGINKLRSVGLEPVIATRVEDILKAY